MKGLLQDFTYCQGDLFSNISQDQTGEIHLENIFQSCLAMFNKPVEQMKKKERMAVVQLLKERNFFSLQKSVPYASKQLQVSKYTIYKYLNEIETPNQ